MHDRKNSRTKEGRTIATTLFVIEIDESRRRLRASLHGYWDMATAHDYIACLSARIARLDRTAGPSYWLVDLLDFPVQANEVAETVKGALASLLTGEERLAVVTPSRLSSMQAQRAIANRTQLRFDTVAEAEAWLAEEQVAG